jgi:hypothetical protein
MTILWIVLGLIFVACLLIVLYACCLAAALSDQRDETIKKVREIAEEKNGN